MVGRLALTHVQKARAASAYRVLIRSSKLTFKSDPVTYHQFLHHAKGLFVEKVLNTDYLVETGSVRAQELGVPSEQLEVKIDHQFDHEIQGILEVSKFLARNIVQAKHADDGKRLVLRFTDQTEIGDNSTIKNPPPTSSFPSSGCCGGSSGESTTPKLSQAALERREKRRLARLQHSSGSSNS